MSLVHIHNNVYYKIFDKSDQCSTGIYNKYRFKDEVKLSEVENNCKAVMSYMMSEILVILYQIHSNIVVSLENSNLTQLTSGKLIADGVVTNCNNVALAIQTADCVPVLLFDKNNNIIGAAHCGWRSVKSGIVKNVIAKMKKLGAEDILAIIGPSILQKSYEVDEEYYNNFIAESKDYAGFFVNGNRSGKFMFDLPGLIKYNLWQEGVEVANHIKEDTYSLPEKYPSYRREGASYSSSILSCITLL